MIQNSGAPDGFPAYLQPAVAAAVDSGIPGAETAWHIFESRSVKPDYATAPAWDIVPRSRDFADQGR
jgi:hypothetical protein